MLKICDSIAVKLFNRKFLLVACGNEVRVYKCGSFWMTLPWKLNVKIHGIVANTDEDRLLIYGDKEFMIISWENDKFSEVTKSAISDWISCAKFLNDGNFCILTGRLVLLEIQLNNFQKCEIIKKISCEDKATLYCSFIHGNSWSNLLCFGGTAMEVVIWKPNINNIFRLSGKNGVTLSIDVNVKFNLLITTSDDRSIKFYKMKVQHLEGASAEEIEYNFSDTYIKGYAHTARVFQGKIIEYNEQPFAITVGEDSNMSLWDINGKLLFKRRHHLGAKIWNFDYDPVNQMLYTVGSDSNCISYCLNGKFEPNLPKKIITENLKEFEYFEKVKFLENHYMVGITNQCNLFYRKNDGDWKFIKHFDNFKCTAMQVYHNRICLAGYKRFILFKFQIETDTFEQYFCDDILENIIRSVCFLSENEILACDEFGNCRLYLSETVILSFKLQHCKEPWITSGYKIDNYLLLSNRQGDVHLYTVEGENILWHNVLKRVNGNLGVTNFNLENNFENFAIISSCGHDNTIKIIKLDKVSRDIKVINRQNIPIAWVGTLFKVDNDKKYFMGFNSFNFVIWSNKDDIIAEVDCGGGHRFWDCRVNLEKNLVQLIFLKRKNVYLFECELENVGSDIDILRNSWHIKSCNSLKILNISHQFVLISGGEDNILKFTKYFDDHLSVQNEMLLHVSSIKDISLVKFLDKDSYLIFSAGGRAQICVTLFNANDFQIEEKCSYMLKSSDLCRKFFRNTQEIDFDPETRIMSIEVLQRNEEQFEIFTSCSDGYIRVFNCTISADCNIDIQLKSEIFYNKCLLQIKLIDNNFIVTAGTDGLINFWDIETLNDKSVPIFKLRHHASGINSLDMKKIDRKLMILSGGDDQNVAFTELTIDNKIMNVENHFIFEKLHISQVTGVKISDNLQYIYSTSVDQKVFQIQFDNFEIINTFSTCVSDVKGICICSANDADIAIIYGCGVESMKV